jgi:hypothetical protein
LIKSSQNITVLDQINVTGGPSLTYTNMIQSNVKSVDTITVPAGQDFAYTLPLGSQYTLAAFWLDLMLGSELQYTSDNFTNTILLKSAVGHIWHSSKLRHLLLTQLEQSSYSITFRNTSTEPVVVLLATYGVTPALG